MLAVLEMLDRENAKLIRQAKIEVAQNMLKEKLPIALISKVTGIKKK